MAMVQTVDFFTPIVDDPFTFGQIAAANSLSDVYAMGGKPVSALSIVGFPDKGDPEILEQIIRGGLSKMSEAKCSVIGGHSIRNDDIQFGYAVTGMIHPKRIWRNGRAREMAVGNPESGIEAVSLEIDHTAVQFLPGAIEAARGGFLPGGLKNNRDFIGDCVGFAPSVSQEHRDLLFDPQTSGGLLVAISPESADKAVSALERHSVSAGRIGKVIPKPNPLLSVR